MSNQQNRPPLWRVMDWAATKDAYSGRPFSPEVQDELITSGLRLEYAAEIRAVADWLVAEETAPQTMRSHELERLCERQHLRQILLKEADRAEAGE